MLKFEDYVGMAREIKAAASSTRDTIFQAMEDMFFMRTQQTLKGAWIKQTIAPDMRDAVVGAQRMLTATDPRFSVPEYTGDRARQGVVANITDWATRSWRNAGVIRQSPIHVDACQSALIYGEINLATQLTSKLADMAVTPAEKKRAEKNLLRTAVLPEVLNPRVCYPIVSSLGLETHLVSRQMRLADVLKRGGKEAEAQFAGGNPYDFKTYNELWDLEGHVTWVDGATKPFILEEHKLSVLPIVYRKIEGSSMWDQYDTSADAVQPFLYGAYKSGLFDRLCLSYTVFFSTLFAIAAGGLFKFKSNGAPGRKLELDFDHPGALVELLPNEDLAPLGTNLLTPEMIQAIKIAEEKLVEATIYKQALGEPLGANAPFSMVSMLSQAGRQPLIPYQKVSSDAIGECMQNAMVLLKEDKQKVEWLTPDGQVVFDPQQVEDDMELEAELEIDLPQDARQNVQLAVQAVTGNILDLETALRDIMKQDQPEKIISAIMRDKMVQALWAGELAKVQAMSQIEINQMMQASQPQQPGMPGQPGAPGQPPVGPTPPGGGEQGGVTPELLQQLMSNQASQGQPMVAPQEAGAPPMPGPNGGGGGAPPMGPLGGGNVAA